jgi:hypothetical protein
MMVSSLRFVCRSTASTIFRRTSFVQANTLSSQTSSQVLLDKYKRLADGLVNGNRASLAQAITLMESSNPDHRVQADLLQQYLFKEKSSKQHDSKRWKTDSFRIGIAGTILIYQNIFLNI